MTLSASFLLDLYSPVILRHTTLMPLSHPRASRIIWHTRSQALTLGSVRLHTRWAVRTLRYSVFPGPLMYIEQEQPTRQPIPDKGAIRYT
jgi:hypothetical protein